MDCPFSKKPCDLQRVVHITNLDKGKVTSEVSLCEHCSANYLKAESEAQSLEAIIANSMLDFFKLILISPVMSKPIPDEQVKTCPQCGTTLADIGKLGRIGCAHCYTHFKAELETVLFNAHKGGVEHVGKEPAHRKVDNVEKIRSLTAKLNEAIKIENYEAAAVLKRKIDELKGQ